MRVVTPEEVEAALAEHAERDTFLDSGGKLGWRFHRTQGWHPDDKAHEIVRFCLMLGQPVSDVLASGLMAALVDEVADLHQMIHRMRTPG